MTDSAQAAIAQANRLDAEARTHKQSAEFHRREAQRKRIQLAEFLERCSELGITVVLEPSLKHTHAQGGTSGDNGEAPA